MAPPPTCAPSTMVPKPFFFLKPAPFPPLDSLLAPTRDHRAERHRPLQRALHCPGVSPCYLLPMVARISLLRLLTKASAPLLLGSLSAAAALDFCMPTWNCAVPHGASRVLDKMRSSPDISARCQLAVLWRQRTARRVAPSRVFAVFAQPQHRRRSPPVRPRRLLFDSTSTLFSYD
uniref:Uncharacterized protein n=1 Tax=Zea mays TaxID=4577 RepID=A0A804NRE4_MAIZE